MKNILAVLAALAAVAAAVPGKPQGCQPATYGCAKNPQSGVDGWQVCDVTHQWVVSTGFFLAASAAQKKSKNGG